jgi:hypothetical protein
MILDDGGDATMLVHKGRSGSRPGRCPPPTRRTPRSSVSSRPSCAGPWPPTRTKWTEIAKGIKGVTEETTTGVHRLYQLAEPVSCSSRRSTSTTRSPSPSSTTSTAAATPSSTVSTAPPTFSSAARPPSSPGTATWARAVQPRSPARAPASSSPRSTRSVRSRPRWRASRSSTMDKAAASATSSSPPPAATTSSPPSTWRR